MTEEAEQTVRVQRRIAFVDDHPILLGGLVAGVGSDPRIDVVATGTTSADARRISAELAPDVLVLDLELHDAPAHQTIRAIHRDCPDVAIVVLTALDDTVVRDELLRAGASAFLTKATTPAQLVEQIVGAKPLASPPILHGHRHRGTSSVLTEQELRVLRLAARGTPNRVIASVLGVSGGTVKRHLANLYKAMAVHTRAEAVSKARLLGMLED